jgi:4-phosphopantoate---beta-alanine ligase
MIKQVPATHPRLKSLLIREKLVSGFSRGLVAREGLIAHGRGEAFDYLLGEKTSAFALDAIQAAAAALLLARQPIISVNGNVAAVSATDVIKLSKYTNAPLEVNLFYRDRQRELAIKRELFKHGATKVYGVGPHASATLPELDSERRKVDPRGILVADVVVVPLEDGDRAEALVKMGKKIIAIDLNPLSRTASVADITIVDNITRAIPSLVYAIKRLNKLSDEEQQKIVGKFDNKRVLAKSLEIIRGAMS